VNINYFSVPFVTLKWLRSLRFWDIKMNYVEKEHPQICLKTTKQYYWSLIDVVGNYFYRWLLQRRVFSILLLFSTNIDCFDTDMNSICIYYEVRLCLVIMCLITACQFHLWSDFLPFSKNWGRVPAIFCNCRLFIII
jgi:hypothetical protein